MSEDSEGSNLDPILLNIVVCHLHDEVEYVIAEPGYETRLRKRMRWFSNS